MTRRSRLTSLRVGSSSVCRGAGAPAQRDPARSAVLLPALSGPRPPSVRPRMLRLPLPRSQLEQK